MHELDYWKKGYNINYIIFYDWFMKYDENYPMSIICLMSIIKYDTSNIINDH